MPRRPGEVGFNLITIDIFQSSALFRANANLNGLTFGYAHIGFLPSGALAGTASEALVLSFDSRHVDVFDFNVKKLLNRRFDFQLTGDLKAINVQWSPSTLKSQIENKLGKFIQNSIEHEFEEAHARHMGY